MKQRAILIVLLACITFAAYGGISRSTAVASPAHVSGAAIVQSALQYVGARFTRTGGTPQIGFNDLGFVRYVFRQNGVRLHVNPARLRLGYARLLSEGSQVTLANLQPGDLLFFKNTIWTGVSHVAIYIDNGQFVHAEWYGRGVTVTLFKGDRHDGNYWALHFAFAVRVVTGI